MKIAFCKMPSQFALDFMLDLGGVVGYIDQIQRKIWGEVGRHIAGMNFQMRSSSRVAAECNFQTRSRLNCYGEISYPKLFPS